MLFEISYYSNPSWFAYEAVHDDLIDSFESLLVDLILLPFAQIQLYQCCRLNRELYSSTAGEPFLPPESGTLFMFSRPSSRAAIDSNSSKSLAVMYWSDYSLIVLALAADGIFFRCNVLNCFSRSSLWLLAWSRPAAMISSPMDP